MAISFEHSPVACIFYATKISSLEFTYTVFTGSKHTAYALQKLAINI